MTANRTLITLVVSDIDAAQLEIIQLISILNQKLQLHAFIEEFLLSKRLRLMIPAHFVHWPDFTSPNEFNCEVCGLLCLQEGIDANLGVSTERFCSSFCRSQSINTQMP